MAITNEVAESFLNSSPPPAATWHEQRAAARRDAIQHIAEAVSAIDASERRIDARIVDLRNLEMTFSEIAEATGMTVSIVRSRYERARGE